ncbi:MAG: HAD family hydrolase [Lachnospiraceae bacterium]|nr:HAD family hydrolase [Lachnospiraceae bacterium]
MLKKQKIIFLDRDGTICTDRGAFHAKITDYKSVLDNIEPIKGCKDALKKLKDNGYMLVVISNQAGVAKGKFKESDIHKFNDILNKMLGDVVDGFYYCIHHKNGMDRNGHLSENAIKDLLLDCGCRKPKIGMFLKCKEDLKNGCIQYIDEEIMNSDYAYKKDRKIYKKSVSPCDIDIEHSYMIGDKKIDLVSGKNFDLKTILVKTGEGEEELKQHNKMMKDRDYDYIANDISDAVNYILEK